MAALKAAELVAADSNKRDNIRAGASRIVKLFMGNQNVIVEKVQKTFKRQVSFQSLNSELQRHANTLNVRGIATFFDNHSMTNEIFRVDLSVRKIVNSHLSSEASERIGIIAQLL
jgi:hypothetical protein